MYIFHISPTFRSELLFVCQALSQTLQRLFSTEPAEKTVYTQVGITETAMATLMTGPASEAKASETDIERNYIRPELSTGKVSDAPQSQNADPTREKMPKGLLSQLVLTSLPDNARNVTRRMKYVLTSIVSLAGMAAPLGSTILMRKSSIPKWY